MNSLRLVEAPGQDELLTSYLVRTANLHGLNAYRFFSYHFPSVAIWNRDFDRTVSDDVLGRLAELYGFRSEILVGMTLRPYVQNISGFGLGSKGWSTQSWVNAVGVYHRIREQHGLQFCPACLRDEPFFKRFWRLSFVVACPRHRCVLLDACTVCGAPVTPHRANVASLSCHHCGASLQRAPITSYPCEIDEVLQIQTQMLDAATSSWFCMSTSKIRSVDFFIGLKYMLLLVRQRNRYCPDVVGEQLNLPPYRLELMRTHHRLKLMTFIGHYLMPEKLSLGSFLESMGITQMQFSSVGPIPSWLEKTVFSLKLGAVRKTDRVKLLRNELLKIRREKPPGWHSRHAQILMDLISSEHGH